MGRPAAGLHGVDRSSAPAPEIAALYETIDPAEVLTFAGAEEAVFCLMNVLVGPGDHAIVTWPGYQSLYEVARANGADVTLHELHESNGWAIDLDLLRQQLTPATRLIVVNLPHNPTGMLADRATFDGLVELAENAGASTCWSTRSTAGSSSSRRIGCPPAPIPPPGASRSASCPSRSRWPGCASAGWRRTTSTCSRALARFKDYTTICSSAPSEILVDHRAAGA